MHTSSVQVPTNTRFYHKYVDPKFVLFFVFMGAILFAAHFCNDVWKVKPSKLYPFLILGYTTTVILGLTCIRCVQNYRKKRRQPKLSVTGSYEQSAAYASANINRGQYQQL